MANPDNRGKPGQTWTGLAGPWAGGAVEAMDVPPIERRYKIKELAELAAQSRRTIQRRIDDGIIRIVRLADGSTRITESEVVRYLNGKAGK